MSVQYAPQKLKVPEGFNNLLEGLAREVLREQPDNIIKFAADHFKKQSVLRGDKDEQPATNDTMETNNRENAVADEAQPSSSPVNAESETENAGTDTETEETAAATKIQAMVRGKKARGEVNALKAEKQQQEKETAETDTDDAEKEAITTPVAAVAKEEEVFFDEEDTEDLTAAAVKIQASFRGMKARKKVEEKKSSEQQNTVADDGNKDIADGGDADAGADADADKKPDGADAVSVEN